MASLFATLVIPPIIALALYLCVLFVLIPLYRRHQRYAAYLPLSLRQTTPDGLLARWRQRLRDFILGSRWWQQRFGAASVDAYLGDEELEDGFDVDDPASASSDRWHSTTNHARIARPPRVSHDIPSDRPDPVQRRLSRDLESGFRDDSDEDVSDDQRGRGRQTAS